MRLVATFFLFASMLVGQSTIVVPHVTVGQGWQTNLEVMRKGWYGSESPADLARLVSMSAITIKFFDPQGRPASVLVGGNPNETTEHRLYLWADQFASVPVKTSGHDNLTVRATSAFGPSFEMNVVYTHDQARSAAPVMPSVKRLRVPYTNVGTSWTRLTVASNSNDEQIAFIKIYDQLGLVVLTTELILPANGNTQLYLPDFPGTDGMSGVVELSADDPVLSAVAFVFNSEDAGFYTVVGR